ncbi:MAG: vanadium-dependent haloperoxidase [Pseudomonadota bacterium]
MAENRKSKSYEVRVQAAELAKSRTHPRHESNGDEQRYSGAHYAMSFSKGLEHDKTTGLPKNPQHFEAFRQAIDDGHIDAFNNRVPVPRTPTASYSVPKGKKLGRRFWEAPTAGVAYDLEGPDCQAVTMAPAPALCSDELAFEMAEVYELAHVRDVPFSYWSGATTTNTRLKGSIDRLNSYSYAKNNFPVRPRTTNESGDLDSQTVFRGSSPGVEKGPYLSQFLLIGNDLTGFDGKSTVDKGQIGYGALQISQKVPEAKPEVDYMTRWNDWLTVQEGFDVNDIAKDGGQEFTKKLRFITTPRDLATYVHFDALYEAYLNACLILLGMKTPFDPGFATLAGMRRSFPHSTWSAGHEPSAGGFALYGGPHILTLVTEVATRALKAARYQKFNVHNRARPEVLAARLHKEPVLNKNYGNQFCSCITDMCREIGDTLVVIEKQNGGRTNRLLPMAFREGSPMHPSYAAGHATVAGACVTILKAFFDTGTVFVKPKKDSPAFIHPEKSAQGIAYTPNKKGTALDESSCECPLTLEGELNKLAANISIGRNMAGVHYFSDYYDSLRMGEEIAIGLLEEQALCYPTDPFVLSLPTFDGNTVRIGAR